MKRIIYGVVLFVVVCLPFTRFAQFRPVDINPQIKSGQLVQKMDNVIVLFDKSSSMGELQGKPMVDEATRLILAKDATKSMITAIPEIQLNTGLRTLWAEETELIYGMKPLSKVEYIKAVNSIENVNHRTSLEKAITAAGNDLKSAKGNSAIIAMLIQIENDCRDAYGSLHTRKSYLKKQLVSRSGKGFPPLAVLSGKSLETKNHFTINTEELPL